MSIESVTRIKAAANALCLALADAETNEARAAQASVEHAIDAWWRSLPSATKAATGVPTGSRDNPFDD